MKLSASILAATILTSAMLTAQVPNQINFQGRLSDATNGPANGEKSMAIRVYDAVEGGNIAYEETLGNVSVTNGIYSFQFGGAGAGILQALNNQDSYLALIVDGVEQTSRIRLLAVPFAMKAAESEKSADAQQLLSEYRVIQLSGDLEFSGTAVEMRRTKTFTIKNDGFGKLSISGISYPAGFTGENWSGILSAGESHDVVVTFAPQALGSFSGQIEVHANALNGSNLIQVSGVGVEAPEGMVVVQGGVLPAFFLWSAENVDTFFIGRTEVSLAQWNAVRAYATTHGYDLEGIGEGLGENYPVTNINIYDVLKWCNAKSEMEGLAPVYLVNGETLKSGVFGDYDYSSGTVIESPTANGYRLPTNGQWTWACRGGLNHQGRIFSGSDDISAVAWIDSNSGRNPKPVGGKAANELGIYDMSGNVYEWVFWSDKNAWIRGGSWYTSADHAKVLQTLYLSASATTRSSVTGFRIALGRGP